MEKIFGENQFKQGNEQTASEEKQGIWLQRQHLWLSAEVAEGLFQNERQIYIVYYDNLGMLLLAPMSDTLFKQVHKCALVMLKDRNLKGDKTLSLQEIIIDHDLDDTDRSLSFTNEPGLNILQVKLK